MDNRILVALIILAIVWGLARSIRLWLENEKDYLSRHPEEGYEDKDGWGA